MEKQDLNRSETENDNITFRVDNFEIGVDSLNAINKLLKEHDPELFEVFRNSLVHSILNIPLDPPTTKGAQG